jgi:hypothetical protein
MAALAVLQQPELRALICGYLSYDVRPYRDDELSRKLADLRVQLPENTLQFYGEYRLYFERVGPLAAALRNDEQRQLMRLLRETARGAYEANEAACQALEDETHWSWYDDDDY